MAYLMCVDTPVYSTRTKQILAPHLMPCPVEFYEEWRKSRLFLRGVNRMPEEDERMLGANSITVKRRLSLSDSYWIKYNKDPAQGFYEITPYTNDFYEYGVSASTKSSPSLTATGSVNKLWKRVEGKTVLYKVMQPAWVKAEVAAVDLAKRLGLPVNDISIVSKTELYVHNFTKPGVMLMRLQPWNVKGSNHFGYRLSDVDSAYKKLVIEGDFHLTTILFDVVVSNYDRISNLSNWGYFKSAVDGRNTHCPLFDFNLAHPEQRNMFLHIVKPQINDAHKAILRLWRPVVAAYGYPAWSDNLEALLQ